MRGRSDNPRQHGPAGDLDALSKLEQGVWAASSGLRGTVGEKYLLTRRCAIPPEHGDLRYNPDLRHPSGHCGPALVALVTDPVLGIPSNLHCTWISDDGVTAEVEPPRLVIGNHARQGSVIRLWPDEYVTYGLGIAEGIETALTLATVLKPVWSLLNAENLAALPVLAGIELLTISVDNDEAGLAAAKCCATRWTEVGCDVRLVIPPKQRTDLNDFARGAE